MAERGNKYYKADSFSLKDLPKILIPTKIMGFIIGGFFALSFVLGIFSFPLGSLMSGSGDLTMKFGWPMTFFTLDAENAEKIPIDFMGTLIDLLLYATIAYVLNVAINYILAKFNYTFSEDAKNAPKLYKK